MSVNPIDRRLLSAASFVREGAVLADIGTDHGYLPVFLLSEGRIERAVLTDVNAKPLDSARENVAAAGLTGRVDFLLTDGAAALDGRGITDFTVCGMGGELIADIVAAAPVMHDPEVRLILQPMSRQAHLRRELYRMGFSVTDESYSYADGRYYVCLLCEFCGTPCEISDVDAELGRSEWREEDRAAHLGYLRAKLCSYERAYEGKRRGGEDDRTLFELCRAIENDINLHK